MTFRAAPRCRTVLALLTFAGTAVASTALAAAPAQAADGTITTLAGTSAGFAGDGGPASQAKLSGPRAAAIAPDGRLLIADSANVRVRQVSTGGVITTIAVQQTAPPLTFGGPTPGGLSGAPAGVAYDAAGAPLVADNGGSFIGRIAGVNNTFSVIAGTRNQPGFAGDGGPATAARLNAPTGIALAPDGSIYIADTGNDRIRRVAPGGTITTFAGGSQAGFSGDGGPATAASLNAPAGVAVGLDGTILIADTGNDRIRRVAADGVITTVAGNGTTGFSGDGLAATGAQLSGPTSVTPLRLGGFVIADTANHRIRRVTPLGTIFTIAGGEAGLAGDEGPASAGLLKAPGSIVATPAGGFVVADTGNSRIRGLASDGALPGPIPGRTLRITRTSGFVRAFVAGRSGSQPLREPDLALLGTRANAEDGEVMVETGTPDGMRTANVSGGEFAIEQPTGPTETKFRLTAPMNGCRRTEGGTGSGRGTVPAGAARASHGAKSVQGAKSIQATRLGHAPLASAAKAKTAKKKRKRRSRKIFVRSNGGHRTSGRYADAVVRGTAWTVQDFCTNTRVTVREGVVAVTDEVKNKEVLVTAGNRYIARLPKR